MINFHLNDDEDDTPLFGHDMQAWSDSLANAGVILGEAFEDANMVGAGYLLRPIPEEPPQPSFDPYECTVLDKPLNVRRGRITMKSRAIGS